jgi:multiple sugar transport system permease protein
MFARAQWTGYVAPAFALLTLVLFSPVFYGLWYSLFRIRYGVPTDFIGLGNYTRLFGDPALPATLWRSLIYTSASVALTVALALAISVWINAMGKRRALIVQMIVIVPWIISTVVATLLFKWVFISDIGLAMSLLRWAGVPDVAVANDPNGAMALLVAVSVWKRLGYAVIIILSGLKGIPDDVYEAARIDGANGWQMFRSITLPLLKTPLLLVIVVLTLSNINTVESPLVLTGGGPSNATRILPMEVYDRAFVHFELGTATALAVLMFAGNILLVLAYVRLAKWRI